MDDDLFVLKVLGELQCDSVRVRESAARPYQGYRKFGLRIWTSNPEMDRPVVRELAGRQRSSLGVADGRSF
jgi:hypothetical protein